MMGSIQTVDANTLRLADSRIFIQTLGPNARNPWEYYGCMSLDDIQQDLGDAEPIYCPSPDQRNAWVIVDEIVGQQALGTTSFTTQARRDGRDAILELKRRRCNTHWQVLRSRCERPDDFSQWDSKRIIRNVRITSSTESGGNPLSGDDNAAAQIMGDLSFWEHYLVTQMSFGEVADAVALAEILDGFYYDSIQCGECGPASNGCQKSYFLAKANAGSPGLAAQIVFKTSEASGWQTRDVTTLTTGASKTAAMGTYLLVFTTTTPGHRYISIADLNDGIGAWSTITSGYVEEPRAVWVKSASEAFMAADNGYIHKLTNPTRAATTVLDGSATTQNLGAIHGSGNVIVAVGAANAVVVSKNGGRTWATVTGPAVGVVLTSVWVTNAYQWFVGGANGNLYFTDNAGKTWLEIELEADVSAVNDIKFYDDVVGYLAVTAGVRGRVYRTTTGGYDWQYVAPNITGLVANGRINVVAPCGPNEVAAGGLALDGTDGIIAVAS